MKPTRTTSNQHWAATKKMKHKGARRRNVLVCCASMVYIHVMFEVHQWRKLFFLRKKIPIWIHVMVFHLWDIYCFVFNEYVGLLCINGLYSCNVWSASMAEAIFFFSKKYPYGLMIRMVHTNSVWTIWITDLYGSYG